MERSQMPKWALRTLAYTLSFVHVEEVLGDVEESYLDRVERDGRLHAWWWLLSQLVRSGLPFLAYAWYWSWIMTRSYILIAFRNLRKHKSYVLINMVGLSVGMACFVLIMAFVRFELSYDTFHKQADRIYRVVVDVPTSTYLGKSQFALTSVPLADAVEDQFPAVEETVRIGSVEALFRGRQQQVYEKGLFAEETFLSVFSFPLIQGDTRTALTEPNTVVLTESMATKYFGNANALGETLEMHLFGDTYTLTVAGIVEDVPANAHLRFAFLLPMVMDYTFIRDREEWGNSNHYTYVMLHEGSSAAQLSEDMTRYVWERKHSGEVYRKGQDDFYALQPLTNIHLYSNANFEIAQNGDIRDVYLFSVLAVLILLIACINYMNLATARASTRFKEVGVRKAIGAYKSQVMKQFMGESVLMALLSLSFVLGLVYVLLPVFGALMECPLDQALVFEPVWLMGMISLALCVGFLSGSYPAFVLGKLDPVRILKGARQVQGRRSIGLRNVLVVGQFATTIVLIVAALVVKQQLDFMRTKDPGYNREHVVAIALQDQKVREQAAALQEALAQHSSLRGLTVASRLPSSIQSSTVIREWDGSEADDRVHIYTGAIGYDYESVVETELVAGRSFSRAFETDKEEAILLNETAAQRFGWEEPLGKTLFMWGKPRRVVGVVEDFNFLSYHLDVSPLLLMYTPPERARYILAKIKAGAIPEAMRFLEATTLDIVPDFPFEYTFLDDEFDQMYKAEAQLGKMFSAFTLLALLIACLGLFGLAAFTAAQRRREVGIRKALGATLSHIVLLFSMGYLRLIGWAFVCALPLAVWGMNRWLDDFAFRIELSPGLFVFAGVLIVGIALLTVSYQSVSVARANPAETLRHE